MLVICTGKGVDTSRFLLEFSRLDQMQIQNLPDPENALEYLRNFPDEVSAVLLSVHGMSVEEAETFINTLRRQSKVPLVALEIYDSYPLEDRITLLEAGLDDYVKDPQAREVNARIKAILRRGPVSMILHVGDLFLDTAVREVWCDPDYKILLPPGRYAVLQKLMAAPGRIFTRNELVYSQHTNAKRIVPVTLHILRKMLEDLGSSVKIVNIRDKGYRIE